MYQINDGQITVFGYPDGATLAQMQRTLENEHATKGVLCADNHKGYAVPIGGVVAYRDAVSPSGVGHRLRKQGRSDRYAGRGASRKY